MTARTKAQSERSLIVAIMQAVRKHHPRAYVRKIADRYTRGIPDLLIVFPVDRHKSSSLLVEAKKDDGELSKIQQNERDDIWFAKGNWLLARSVEDVLGELKRLGAIP